MIKYVPESEVSDYRDLIKQLVGFGVPLNEVSFLGAALNTLFEEGSYVFDGASDFTQHQMIFIAFDLVAGGADLTQDTSESSALASFYDNRSIIDGLTPRYGVGEFLYAVGKRRVYGKSFPWVKFHSPLQLQRSQLRAIVDYDQKPRIAFI